MIMRFSYIGIINERNMKKMTKEQKVENLSEDDYFYFPLVKNKEELDSIFSEDLGADMLFSISDLSFEYQKINELVGFMPEFACSLMYLSVYKDNPVIRELIDESIVMAKDSISSFSKARSKL